MPSVPIYERRSSADPALPGVRQTGGATPDEFGAGVAQGLGRLGTASVAAYQRGKRTQDGAIAMDAHAKLVDADLALRDAFASLDAKAAVTRGGGASERPRDDPSFVGPGYAVGQTEQTSPGETAIRNFDGQAAAIRGEIPEGPAREAFDRLSMERRQSFSEFIDQRTAQQSKVLAADSLKATLDASTNDAVRAALSGDIAAASKAADSARTAASAYSSNQGLDARAAALGAATSTNAQVIDALLGADKPTEASRYLEEHRDEIDAGVLPKIESAVAAHVAKQDGAEMARGTVAAAGMVSLRAWDPTPVVRPDGEKIAAEMRQVEADPNTSEAVKQSYREHLSGALQAQRSAFKSTVDDVYSRALTKLERNGNKLSDLAAERDYLLDPNVEAGDVWRAIVGRATSRAHASQRNTPAQDQKWTEFLFTLEKNKTKYDDQAYTPSDYGQEWHELSQRDYERGASYIASMRGQAGRPDETLPPTVVSQIIATGGPNGYAQWGAKGPSTPDARSRLTVIEQDLLAAQAKARAAGGQLDQATVDEALKKWGTKGTVPGSGIIFDDRVTRAEYAANPRYADLAFVDPNAPQAAQAAPADPFASVPQEHRAEISSALQRGGRPTSEDWMLWAWRQANHVTPNPPPSKRTPDEASPAGARRGGY